MRKIFIFFIFSINIFGQKVELGNHKNQLKIYNYVLKNLETIKKNNFQEILYVNLNFNKNHFIEKINYFSCNKKNMLEKVKLETKVSSDLNEYVEKTFSFFSNNPFFSKQSGESSFSFYIPLDKKSLEIAIKEVNGNKYLNKNKENIGIKQNSKFTLDIKNLFFNKIKYNDKKSDYHLIVRNSELIEIAQNLYLVFRIIKTNDFESNYNTDYFEYKIMYLDGTSSELFDGSRFSLDSNEVEISEINLSGGNDNLSNSYYCDSEEFEDLSSKFIGLKFNIKIKFEK